jgi:hypothetical protein
VPLLLPVVGACLARIRLLWWIILLSQARVVAAWLPLAAAVVVAVAAF